MSKTLQETLFGVSGQMNLATVIGEDEPEGEDDSLLEGMVGQMFWYTVPSTLRVERSVVAAAYEHAGIDRKFLPPVVRVHDAFRRATQDLSTPNMEVLDDTGKKRRVALMMREVASDSSRVVRQMVVEVRDEAHERLLYKPCAQFDLWKYAGRATCVPLDEIADVPAAAGDLVRTAMDRFWDAWPDATKFLDDGHIRRALGEMMTAAKVIDLRRNGGLYFALRAHAGVVEQIETLFECLKAAGVEDPQFCSAPLVDRSKQRGAVAAAALRQVTEEAEALQRSVIKISEEQKEGRKVRKDTAHGYLQDVKRLQDLTDEYRAATRDSLAGATAALDVLKTEVVSLMMVAD